MVTARIEDILVTTNIISGIVYAENFVLEYAAVFEQDLIYHGLGSTARVQGTIMHCQNARKKMTFQLRNKVLEI